MYHQNAHHHYRQMAVDDDDVEKIIIIMVNTRSAKAQCAQKCVSQSVLYLSRVHVLHLWRTKIDRETLTG